MKISSFVVIPRLLLALGVIILVAASALSQDNAPTAGPEGVVARLPGQSATMLSDGSLLLLGGKNAHGVSSAAYIQQATAKTHLASHMHIARAWQSAAVLPDGTIAIMGGVGSNGKQVGTIERFDPKTQTFGVLGVNAITLRSHHTATLLTDGTVIVIGGISSQDKTSGTAQIWDPRTNRATSLVTGLNTPRSDHTAVLTSRW
jgi:hypothetical protein